MLKSNSDEAISVGLWILAIACLLFGILNMFGVIKIAADDSTKFLLGLCSDKHCIAVS